MYELLQSLRVFLVQDDEWKDIEKCWEYYLMAPKLFNENERANG